MIHFLNVKFFIFCKSDYDDLFVDLTLGTTQTQQPAPVQAATPNKKVAVEEKQKRRLYVRRNYSEHLSEDDACLYIIIKNGKSALPVSPVCDCCLMKIHISYDFIMCLILLYV